MGQEVPFNIPLVEGMACFHGLSKVQVNLEGPILFQWSLGWAGLIWDGLDATGHLWMPRCLGVLIYWVFGLFVHRGPWSQYHRYLQCAQCHDWFTHLFGVVLLGKIVFQYPGSWRRLYYHCQEQFPNSNIGYCLCVGCMHVLSIFYKLVVHSHIHILQCLFCFIVSIRSVGLLLDFPQISSSMLWLVQYYADWHINIYYP